MGEPRKKNNSIMVPATEPGVKLAATGETSRLAVLQ
jgi:hypothetical protein